MMNPTQFAMSMIQNNPQVMNNPMAQNYIGVIQSGDAQKGQQLAEDHMNSLRDSYRSADPAMKKQMRADVAKLLSEMPS